jgi:methyl-accepting chemotaxis protein
LKLTIGQKILFGYGFAILCMALTGIAAYTSTQQLFAADNLVSHTLRVIDVAREIRSDLFELNSASWAYIDTADDRFLESGAALRTHLLAKRQLLRTVTADNPTEQRQLDVLEPVIERRVADLVSAANLRKEKGFPAALLQMERLNSPERAAEIRNGFDGVESEQRTLLDQRNQIAQIGAQSTNRIILYGTVAGIALAVIFGIATRRSITRHLQEFQQFVTSVAEGNLTQTSVPEGKDELGVLAHGLNHMAAQLRNMATQTRAVTEKLTSTTMEILASSKEVSALTGEQLAAYQQTNATMQQVSESGVQIVERAQQVTATAAAVSIANTSGLDAVQKANQTVEAIHEQAEAVARNIVALSEKTQLVGDILATVNDIAEQSHLLALNAAIEAAAAGEQGRSFAVVAGEIKNLADQSKAATVRVKFILGDIQKEINTSVMLTEEAVKRVDLGKHQADVAAAAIRNMAANIDQSVQAFQQIVAGTNQQQIGFENVMQAMNDLSRSSEQAATSTRQTENSAANLSNLSAQLDMATEGYRL